MVRRSRKEIYILSACVALLSLQSALRVSARTAADFFADAPVGVIDTFDRNTRLDMLDYFRNGMTTASQNVFGGQSRITALSDSSLTVEISSRSRMQFAMLPQKWKSVLLLHYIEGYSLKEISEILDVSENAVKKRMQRAKEALRRRMET